jgi:hypothetical protein
MIVALEHSGRDSSMQLLSQYPRAGELNRDRFVQLPWSPDCSRTTGIRTSRGVPAPGLRELALAGREQREEDVVQDAADELLVAG